MVKAHSKQDKDRESRRKWRKRLTGGGKGSGHCIDSGFECVIPEAQGEDKVLGCRGEMSTVSGCRNGDLGPQERETLSRRPGNLHLKVSVGLGVWMDGVKVIEERTSRLNSLKRRI